MKGLLITLEGIDGTGKTTVASCLNEHLRISFPDKRFLFTAEPTAGRTGQIIRDLLSQKDQHLTNHGSLSAGISQAAVLQELFLFMADHAEHLSSCVIPALRRGDVVVCDRYSDSRAAYQGASLKGVIPNSVYWIQDLHSPWSVAADLTLLFTLDAKDAIKRCASRSQSGISKGAATGPEKFEHEAFLRDVDRNFRLIATEQPGRFVLIDSSGGINEISQMALDAVAAFLLKKS